MFISIHVPRAGYDTEEWTCTSLLSEISIHVPRAGYDADQGAGGAECGISIHVPRAGYDSKRCFHVTPTLLFLSTYPVRGTTRLRVLRVLPDGHFYPRTPCGVRLKNKADYDAYRAISIHVPRAGYDRGLGR